MRTEGAQIGRRALLRRSFLASVWCVLGVVATGTAARADTKLTQKDAEYQPTPKNGQTCATCQYFTAPSGCKIVLGKVSPQGWCAFFATKTPK
jgi:High potential iron-sulfur protein